MAMRRRECTTGESGCAKRIGRRRIVVLALSLLSAEAVEPIATEWEGENASARRTQCMEERERHRSQCLLSWVMGIEGAHAARRG